MYGCDIKQICDFSGMVALVHCKMTITKSLCIERHEKNHTLGITMEVRRLYIPFIMSKSISVHDGDMIVGVLNKNNVQKNTRSAFYKRKNVCDTFFDEWARRRTYENDRHVPRPLPARYKQNHLFLTMIWKFVLCIELRIPWRKYSFLFRINNKIFRK